MKAILSALVVALAGTAAAQDKSHYHLFNPTPRELMREMATDRPDTTESPYTVDAGHFQVEMSLVDFTRAFDAGLRADVWTFGQMNLKAGLTDNTDLQVIFNSYTTAHVSGQGLSADVSGFSDVVVRVKRNLWGNEGGKTALALMPYVTIPTQAELSGDRWAGGLIVPLSIELTDRFTLSVMVEGDLVPDATSSGYDVSCVHSASLGIELTEQAGMYLELVGAAGTGGLDYQALFNTGFTFNLTDNLMVDAGVRIGLNNETPEFGAFTGLSFRY